ncbi:MAG: hypothetical protein R3200_02925 [Xanthomonadales bacterium]|nr:hypothetical protein [Xanthomonadales bacterium]
MSSIKASLTVVLALWIALGLLLGQTTPVSALLAPLGGSELWLVTIPLLSLLWVRYDLLWAIGAAIIRRHSARRRRRSHLIRV